LRSPADAYKDAVAWLDRLAAGDHTDMVQRHIITVPLSGDRVEVERRARTYGDFARMNGHWNQTASAKTHARLAADSEEWENYHTLYQQARTTWMWVPYVELQKDIERGSKNLVVADFGCGEDLLGQQLRNKGFTVYSFDHVSIGENVTALDIGEGVPLDDDEIDIAVFSLSLMGHNNGDYLREAARVLAYDGRIHIVEAASRLDKIDDIEDRLRRLGFKLTDLDRIGEPAFIHITARRTDHEPDPITNLIYPPLLLAVSCRESEVGGLSVGAAAVQSVTECLIVTRAPGKKTRRGGDRKSSRHIGSNCPKVGYGRS
jgi:SAM-dependent methyltransferase